MDFKKDIMQLKEQHNDKISVLYAFKEKRKEKLRLCQIGLGPDEMLYGLNHLDHGRFQVDFIELNHDTWSWFKFFCYPIEYLMRIRLKIGFSLHLVLDNLKKIRQADIVISTGDICGLPFGMLKCLGRVKTPMIYITHGLSDRMEKFPEKSVTRQFFTFFYGRFLRCTERILVLGEGSAGPLIKIFALDSNRVSYLFFGVDTQFWTSGNESSAGSYILSVGSDPARDYETLLKTITDEHLKVVTRLPIPREWLREHVEVSSDFTDIQLRELYQHARFVVIPLKNVAQPSGQSATLQAMACGKTVILTRTRGLWDPKHMQHLDNCYLVEPGDIKDLKQAIQYLSDNPGEVERIGRNARRTVEERYNSSSMATALERYIREILSCPDTQIKGERELHLQ